MKGFNASAQNTEFTFLDEMNIVETLIIFKTCSEELY
jgi:hypothetical protein